MPLHRQLCYRFRCDFSVTFRLLRLVLSLLLLALSSTAQAYYYDAAGRVSAIIIYGDWCSNP